MTETTSRYTIHYNGLTYKLDFNPFEGDDVSQPGTITVNAGEGKSLTFATGPGIPIVVEKHPVKAKSDDPAKKSRAIILN